MEREIVLRQALAKNKEERKRWTQYIDENQSALNNIEMFSKHLEIDVMVPLGTKALVQGQINHTNEVFAGHFQGYFTKCSASTAHKITFNRVKAANEHLEKLNAEAKLWEDKLNRPYDYGAFQLNEQSEIIEPYDEDAEKVWREKHSVNVKTAKVSERLQRSKESDGAGNKTYGDIILMLDEAELMEELENELETLTVDNVSDETVAKLISGEIKLSECKTRVPRQQLAPLEATVKGKAMPTVENETHGTKEASIDTVTNETTTAESQSSGEDSDVDLSEEVKGIKKQAKLLPAGRQRNFYDSKIKSVKKKIQDANNKVHKYIDKKNYLLHILDDLVELGQSLESEDESGLDESHNGSEASDSGAESENASMSEQAKRRVSFVEETQVLEFNCNESVSQLMLLESSHQAGASNQRDIIELDDTFKGLSRNQLSGPQNEKQGKSKLSHPKFVSVNPEEIDLEDCDVVGQILGIYEAKQHTVNISFKHSSEPPLGFNQPKLLSSTEKTDVPTNPSDFYRLFLKNLQSSEKDHQQTIPQGQGKAKHTIEEPMQKHTGCGILREEKKSTSYLNPRETFHHPKSILRNADARSMQHSALEQIEKESWKAATTDGNKQAEDNTTAFNKVISEVMERPNPTNTPDLLPTGNFIDAHAPKKRVSQFKMLRGSPAGGEKSDK